MFFDDIIIQPHCKMLFLPRFQSVNHYTSMLLSFLGVFEIHSVDWFGLVFVLPLLKNKNTNYFQCMCAFAFLIQLCDQTWAFHPRTSRPHLVLSQCGFPIHSGTLTKNIRPLCLAVLLPGTALNCPGWFFIYFFSRCHLITSLIQSSLFREGLRLTRAGESWALPLSGGEAEHTKPLNPCPRHSPPTPVGTRPLPTLGTPTGSLRSPAPASPFPSGLHLTSHEVMAHESDSWQWMTGRKLP